MSGYFIAYYFSLCSNSGLTSLIKILVGCTPSTRTKWGTKNMSLFFTLSYLHRGTSYLYILPSFHSQLTLQRKNVSCRVIAVYQWPRTGHSSRDRCLHVRYLSLISSCRLDRRTLSFLPMVIDETLRFIFQRGNRSIRDRLLLFFLRAQDFTSGPTVLQFINLISTQYFHRVFLQHKKRCAS